MGKLKEFPNYGFLNISGVKYMESLKYRKNIGKHEPYDIIGLLKIFRVRQMFKILKICGK